MQFYHSLLLFLDSFCLILKIVLSEMGLDLNFSDYQSSTVQIFCCTLLVFPNNINNTIILIILSVQFRFTRDHFRKYILPLKFNVDSSRLYLHKHSCCLPTVYNLIKTNTITAYATPSVYNRLFMEPSVK